MDPGGMRLSNGGPILLKTGIRPVTIIVIVIGFLVAAPTNVFVARQTIDPTFKTVDGSWEVALPAALATGEIAGRDFIFSYGPLYQLTHALGLLIPPGNIASLLRFQYVVEALLIMSGVWLVLALTHARFA